MTQILARIAPTTGWRISMVRDNQSLDQLEAFFQYVARAGVLRGGKVTKTAANEVSLEANTIIGSKGVVWDIGDNVVDAGPPVVLLGTDPLPRTVAGTPSTNVYVFAQLVRTPTTDPLAYTTADAYAVVLTYSATATPVDDEHIPLAIVALDGSGNVTGSIGDVMPEPAGPKYLHQWPNVGYRNVPVPGTGVFTPSAEDLAGGGWELTCILTGNRQVELAPETGRFLLVINSTTGAFTLTIRTPGTTGINLARLAAALLWVTPAGVAVIATTDLLLAGAVPATRALTAGAALTGGGNLSADRTFDVAVDGATIEVSSDALRVKALGITDAHVAAANKDGAAGTASLRTLGTGVAQAAQGSAVLSKVADDALADGVDIGVGNGTGSKIGTASSQKLGFFGVAPVAQPAANADTSGATLADLETEVNELKALLRSLGFMAP